MKIHCEQKQAISDGTVVVEATSPDSTKGTMHLVCNAAGQNMNMDVGNQARSSEIHLVVTFL